MTIEVESYSRDLNSKRGSKVDNQIGCANSPIPIPNAPPPSPAVGRIPIFRAETWRSHGHEKSEALCLIPRIVPELGKTNDLPLNVNSARSSEIRYTLNSQSNGSFDRRKTSFDSTEPLSSCYPRNICGAYKVREADSIKAVRCSTFFESPSDESFTDHERNAANALLELKKCSAEVSSIAHSWSKLQNIPLCDFIVVQKKCEAMLDKINALKVSKINTRGHEDEKGEKISQNQNEKCSSQTKRQSLMNMFRAKSKSFNKRSSSIISIVNLNSERKDNRVQLCRSDSLNSGLERSPILSSSISPASMRLQSPGNKDSSDVLWDDPTDASDLADDNCNLDGLYGSLNSRNSIRFGKSSKSGKNRNTHMKCLHCSATDTPEWRKGPRGPATLCNACGLFYKKLIRKFGVVSAGVVMSQRRSKNPQDRKVPRSA
ncbi:hypothetical protein HG535_0B03210 [Zygotorulaspora mrakii]|uniref:GATA-type domain-containing protein n=1 Tax=Zygotorulaspora mrakii TaxID=42260 RepID=A0A7H9B0H0_ZYGMR|nr:uncharacterized protein HG535_0B03210 [Zygotorulaspora mrakii]QLG71282.1 hypothetical protein HG535_0B03210 [Zygotorulaspora mrakii]